MLSQKKWKLLFLKTFIAGYLVVSSHKMWTSLLFKTWLLMEGLFCVRSENVDNFFTKYLSLGLFRVKYINVGSVVI